MPDQNATPAAKDELRAAEKERARAMAEGLRGLAGMVEQNPDLAHLAKFSDLYAFFPQSAEEQAALARAALKAGAKVEKDITSTQHNLVLRWGPVGAFALAARGQVCERVVTGTRKVTRAVKDPVALAAVPEIEVEETVEDVEWVCRPVLAATEAGA